MTSKTRLRREIEPMTSSKPVQEKQEHPLWMPCPKCSGLGFIREQPPTTLRKVFNDVTLAIVMAVVLLGGAYVFLQLIKLHIRN
jgi:hypothetical protein